MKFKFNFFLPLVIKIIPFIHFRSDNRHRHKNRGIIRLCFIMDNYYSRDIIKDSPGVITWTFCLSDNLFSVFSTPFLDCRFCCITSSLVPKYSVNLISQSSTWSSRYRKEYSKTGKWSSFGNKQSNTEL